MIEMRRKVKVTINLEPEVAKKAKELGLNISKICENALKDYIDKVTGFNSNNTTENSSKNTNLLVVDGYRFTSWFKFLNLRLDRGENITFRYMA